MMSLTPMAPSAWRYYAEEIVRGREDYFAKGAERPGRFLGRGAAALGIADHEAPVRELERLFGHGADPRTGAPLGRGFDPDNERAVAGFALTFSPPKSVSALWAVGDQPIADQVLAAHDAAVAASLAFLEDHAAFTRRGHNGILQVDTEGLVAAGFVHRTSRAADPQLHTHLLVANKVRADDGAWLALDGRELFATQKATGMLYKAALRAELTERLGVKWTGVDDNGAAEIVGVPHALLEQWSARRHELKALGDELIANRAADLGRSLSPNERAGCFQIAAYRTRTPKIDTATPTEELRARWRSEAEAWGHAPEHWLPEVTGRRPPAPERRVEEAAAEVIARLEERTATWTRAEVVEEVARVVTSADAESLRVVAERLTDCLLADTAVLGLASPLPVEVPATLRRRDGLAQSERHGASRFTTRATLRREAAVLELVARGRDANAAVVPEAIAARVLDRSSLGEDQREAVRGLVSGGERFALLVGPAGTGKSRALDAAREAWIATGFDPIGLAPSAMAASVLRDEAGLRSDTLAKFLFDTDRGRSTFLLDHRSVVVLDEAGMARTDDLAKLLHLVEERDAKVVLVGDPHQLGAVGPGGIFRTLVGDHGAQELETVRRFRHAWEAAASLHLREGNPSILPAYLRHGRLEGGSRAEMVDRAFAAWKDAHGAGQSLLLMAGDNATTEELSRRCRAELVARGHVGAESVRIATGHVSYGDEIVTLENDRRIKTSSGEFVHNGARWSVTGTVPDGSIHVASLETGERAVLPSDYVREHVALGYALTIHKAQGKTAESAIVLVDEKMSAAQLYVGMSRGRDENRAFVICCDDDPDAHVRRPASDALEVLAKVLRHDEVDRSAHDVIRRNFVRFDDPRLLADLHDAARWRVDHEAGPDRSAEIAALAPRANLDAARAALREAQLAASRAENATRLAQSRVTESEREPLRAHLPGRLGQETRRASESEQHNAQWALGEARRREQRALRECEAARARLANAERATRDLVSLRQAQVAREAWIAHHPAEVAWERDLRARIEVVARPGQNRGDDYAYKRVARSRGQRPGMPSAERSLRRAPLDPATEAVLKRPRHGPPPQPVRSPRQEGPVRER
jgi:conjugative relaxase-like TrwC/TraI family protein